MPLYIMSRSLFLGFLSDARMVWCDLCSMVRSSTRDVVLFIPRSRNWGCPLFFAARIASCLLAVAHNPSMDPLLLTPLVLNTLTKREMIDALLNVVFSSSQKRLRVDLVEAASNLPEENRTLLEQVARAKKSRRMGTANDQVLLPPTSPSPDFDLRSCPFHVCDEVYVHPIDLRIRVQVDLDLEEVHRLRWNPKDTTPATPAGVCRLADAGRDNKPGNLRRPSKRWDTRCHNIVCQ